jgi:hypothetical protein
VRVRKGGEGREERGGERGDGEGEGNKRRRRKVARVKGKREGEGRRRRREREGRGWWLLADCLLHHLPLLKLLADVRTPGHAVSLIGGQGGIALFSS